MSDGRRLKVLQSIDQMGVGGIQDYIRLVAKYSMHEHAVTAYVGLIGEEMRAQDYRVEPGIPVDEFDVVVAHTVGGWRNDILYDAKRKGKKTVEVMHSNAITPTKAAWIDAFVSLNGIAHALNEPVGRPRCGGHQTKRFIIPCPIEYEALPKKPNGRYIGRLSRLVPEKKPQDFIEVARHCPDLEFLLGGDGPMLDELKRTAPSNVTFTGLVRDFPGFYSQLKVFLYPTSNDYCSSACAMAMASGLPIVTYDIPSMRDVFGDWVWYAQGLDDLHLVLRHVLGWDQQVRDKIDTGLDYAKKFAAQRVAAEFDRLYQDLV